MLATVFIMIFLQAECTWCPFHRQTRNFTFCLESNIFSFHQKKRDTKNVLYIKVKQICLKAPKISPRLARSAFRHSFTYATKEDIFRPASLGSCSAASNKSLSGLLICLMLFLNNSLTACLATGVHLM